MSSPVWEIILPVFSMCEWGDRGVTDADGVSEVRLVRFTSTLSWYWISDGGKYAPYPVCCVYLLLFTPRKFLIYPDNVLLIMTVT